MKKSEMIQALALIAVTFMQFKGTNEQNAVDLGEAYAKVLPKDVASEVALVATTMVLERLMGKLGASA